MADEILNKMGHAFNAITQQVSHEVTRSSKEPANASLKRVADGVVDALAEGEAPRYYHTDLDKGTKGDILRPLALGYKAGAMVAHAYERGAKYVFGRGQRHETHPGKTHDLDRKFGADRYQEQAHFEFGGDALESADAERQRAAARHKNNLRALKQEGALGLLTKGVASGLGNIVGAAFCGGAAKAEVVAQGIAEASHAFNAVARTVLVGLPMVGAVLTGVLVGLTATAGVAAWKGAQALHQRHKQKPKAATEAPKKNTASAPRAASADGDEDFESAHGSPRASRTSSFMSARSFFDDADVPGVEPETETHPVAVPGSEATQAKPATETAHTAPDTEATQATTEPQAPHTAPTTGAPQVTPETKTARTVPSAEVPQTAAEPEATTQAGTHTEASNPSASAARAPEPEAPQVTPETEAAHAGTHTEAASASASASAARAPEPEATHVGPKPEATKQTGTITEPSHASASAARAARAADADAGAEEIEEIDANPPGVAHASPVAAEAAPIAAHTEPAVADAAPHADVAPHADAATVQPQERMTTAEATQPTENVSPAAEAPATPSIRASAAALRTEASITTRQAAVHQMQWTLAFLNRHYEPGTLPSENADTSGWSTGLGPQALVHLSDEMYRITYEAYEAMSEPEQDAHAVIEDSLRAALDRIK